MKEHICHTDGMDNLPLEVERVCVVCGKKFKVKNNMDKKVTDLEHFALMQVVRPYQNMIINKEEPIKVSPYALEELAKMLENRDNWSNLVLNRIYRCGFWCPKYMVNPLITVIRQYNIERKYINVPQMRFWDIEHKRMCGDVKIDTTEYSVNNYLKIISEYYIIMRSTGIRDVDKIMLFEGDIYKFLDLDLEGYYKVIWDQRNCAFKSVAIGKSVWNDILFEIYENQKSFKIVGNIHKNLELLK